MSEPSGGTNPRSYQLGKRVESVAETRQRIVAAAVELHGTIGPAATTISALAEKAGVTRLTVYRHFPDDRALFAACSQHWAADQLMPDPAAWSRIGDPARRIQVGLSDLYRFYREAEPMLTNVRRDAAALPSELRERTAATDERHADALLRAFTLKGARRRRVHAVLAHAVSFWTWRSLCVDGGLSNREAVQAMTDLVTNTATPRSRSS